MDRIRGEVLRLLEAGVAGLVFPGACSCVSWREEAEELHVEVSAGRLMRGLATPSATTLYDLASLTKLFVATAALRLYSQGRVDLDVPTESIFSDVKGSRGGAATLGQLLSHRARLAPWGAFYLA